MFRRHVLCIVPALVLACDKAESTAPVESKLPAPTAAAAPEGDKPAEVAAAKPEEKAPEAAPAAELGQPAPDFTLTDLEGKEHKLSEHRGKIVVLEWFNPGCPFVQNAHLEGPLKDLAKNEIESGVVWLAINSGAEGKQGTSLEDNQKGVETFGITHPILLDGTGAVGKLYGAEKTPHIFIVDAEGKLVYRGALDNAPAGKVDGGGEHVNYVSAALAELKAGKPITIAETPSYGCTVKYAS